MANTQAIKVAFEHYIRRTFAQFEHADLEFHSTDGYRDEQINTLWIGFCAGFLACEVLKA